MKRIQKFVRETRARLGLTHEEYAYEIGSDPRCVYRWEKGEYQPKGEVTLNIIKLCMDRGIRIDDLYLFIKMIRSYVWNMILL